MQVSELFQLTQWIDEQIVSKNVLQLYQNLHAILQRNSQPSQARQPFETQRDQLLQAISLVQLELLSEQQIQFLHKIEIADYVGPKAVKAVEDILFRNVIDSATAAQKILAIAQRIERGVQKAGQLQQLLKDTVPTEAGLKKRVLVRVAFKKGAAISNIVALRMWSDEWFEIGRGLAMINDSSPEEVSVVGAGKGSIIVELALAYAVAKTLSDIMIEVLKVTERVVDIQRKAEEVKVLRLANSKIAKELEDESRKEKERGVDQITEKIAKAKKKKDSDEGDKVTALRKAVQNLVAFLEKGGEVDYVLPEGDVKEEELTEVKQLRTSFKEIRALESQIKELEDKKNVPANGAST